MKSFANFTIEAKEALEKKDWQRLGRLMDLNFEKRREIYGEAALGQKNLQMIEIARKHSAHCKFPGKYALPSAQCSKMLHFSPISFIQKGDVRKPRLRLKSSPYSTKNGRNENISQKCKQTSDSRKTDRI